MPGFTPNLLFPYPLYTEPTNVPAQIQAAAEAVDDAVVIAQTNINNALSRISGGVSAIAAQAIPNAAFTTVQWVTEDFDTGNFFNLGVSNTNCVIPTGATYLARAEVRAAASATGSRSLRFQVGGVTVPGTTHELLATPGGAQTHHGISAIMSLAAADVLTVQYLQGSGGALNIDFRRFTLYRLN